MVALATRKDLSSIFFPKNFLLISNKSHKASRENLSPFGVMCQKPRGGGGEEGIHPTLVLIGLTLWAPRVLLPSHQAPRGVEKDPSQYLKKEKCYKPETFGGVRSIL